MGRIWTNGSGLALNATNLNSLEGDVGRSVKPWAANTDYTAGQAVIDPTGNFVTANSTHTSGASYTAAHWTTPYAGKATDTTAQQARQAVAQIQSVPRIAPAGMGWGYFRLITVTDSGTNPKYDFAVNVALTSSNFDFLKTATDGSDIQFRGADGVTVLDHWVESWSLPNLTASVWVKVPYIAAGSTVTLRLYYGAKAQVVPTSNLRRALTLGADFDDQSARVAHPAISSPTVIAQMSDFSGATTGPHTLSLLDYGTDAASPNGYRFWGYIGLQNNAGSNVYIAFSHDAKNWAKQSAAILTGSHRWPDVKRDSTGLYHMIVAEASSSRLDRYTSSDGLTNWTLAETVVPYSSGTYKVGNPYVMVDPISGLYYLYYMFNQQSPVTRGEIRVRRATTIQGLTQAPDVRIFETPLVLAAPAVAYFDGLYWMYVEDYDNSTPVWRSQVYTSTTPTGPWLPATNSMLVTDNEACMRPYVVDGQLLLFSSIFDGASTWTLDERTATPARGTAALPYTSTYPLHAWGGYAVANMLDDAPGQHVGQVACPTGGPANQQSVYADKQHPAGFALKASVKRVAGTYWYFRWALDFNGVGYRCYIGNTGAQWSKISGWGGSNTVITSPTISNYWTAGYNTVEVKITPAGVLTVALNGNTVISATDTTYDRAGYLSLEASAGETWNYDYFFVRPYDGSDPAVTVGSENVA
jgi:hypothetical protein